MKKSKGVFIYDIEQFRNFHSCTFYNIHTGEWFEFVIHKNRNDSKEYFEFLTKECKLLIGFNNINYDNEILVE